MAIDLVQVLHDKYHPSKAAGQRKEGIFTVYHFEDGAELRVRAMFFKRLFGSQPWERVKELPSNVLYSGARVALHKVKNLQIVTRSFPKLPRDTALFYFYALENYPESRVELLRKILGKKIVVESPVLELTTPERHRLIATRFVEGNALHGSSMTEAQHKAYALNSAQLMAKLHVAGFSHGHLLLTNTLFWRNKLTVTDPKYLRELKQVSDPDDVDELILKLKGSLSISNPDELVVSPVERPQLAIPNDLLVTMRDVPLKHRVLFLDEYARQYRVEYQRRNLATSSQQH